MTDFTATLYYDLEDGTSDVLIVDAPSQKECMEKLQARIDVMGEFKRFNVETSWEEKYTDVPYADSLNETWAVIDPHWGEPVVVSGTVSKMGAEGAIKKAIWLQDLSIYSGAHLNMVPEMAGSWKSLFDYGYRVRQIEINIMKRKN